MVSTLQLSVQTIDCMFFTDDENITIKILIYLHKIYFLCQRNSLRCLLKIYIILKNKKNIEANKSLNTLKYILLNWHIPRCKIDNLGYFNYLLLLMY